MRRRVLVIRLGALGDFVLSFAAFAAIRAHEAAAEITLLTTAPYADLARAAPWFDRVEIDAKPPVWNIPGLVRLARQMRGFAMVYDLQTSSRSTWYRMLAGRAGWSGIAGRGSHPHANPDRDRMHTRERQQDQLAAAGIAAFPLPDMVWLAENTRQMPIPPPYVLLVPGAAPHRPAKRWPATHYGALATMLRDRGFTPVVIGAAADGSLAAAMPDAVDLTGRTTIGDIAALAERAAFAVGNDTGPMHVIGAVGCRSVVLFSDASNPALTAPRGPDGTWPVVIRVPDLSRLSVERVASALPGQEPVDSRTCSDASARP